VKDTNGFNVCQWALHIRQEGLFCALNSGKRVKNLLSYLEMKGGTGIIAWRKTEDPLDLFPG
jgi:hypothetical protein